LIAYAATLLNDKKIVNNIIHTEAAIPSNVYNYLLHDDNFYENMYKGNFGIKGNIFNSYSINDKAIEAFDITLSALKTRIGVPGLPTPISKDFDGNCKLTNIPLYQSAEVGGLGNQFAYSEHLDRFFNHRASKYKAPYPLRRSSLPRPFAVIEHSSAYVEYFYDIQDLFNFISDPENYNYYQ
jgi:hypothetical protein